MATISERVSLRHLRLPRLGCAARTRLLLACGAGATLLYVGMDTVSALLTSGYSYKDQTISELSAVDAPARPYWLPLGLVYAALTVAGGAGVWAASGGRRRLHVVAGCLVGVGVLGLVAWPFAPMHQREVLAAGGDTFSDTLHLILGGADSLLFISSIAFGATALGRRFRLYSLGTLAAVLIAGMLTGLAASKVAADEPTPWLGIEERIAVLGSMIWIAVLCAGLMRSVGKEDSP
jgi:hypothetical protein